MEVRLVSVSVAVTSAIVMLPLSSEAFTRAACTSAAWMPPTFELSETSCASMRVAWTLPLEEASETDDRPAKPAASTSPTPVSTRIDPVNERGTFTTVMPRWNDMNSNRTNPSRCSSVPSMVRTPSWSVNETLRRSFVQYSTWKASSSVGSKRMLWHPS